MRNATGCGVFDPRHARAGWVFSNNAVVVATLARVLVFVAVASVGDGVNAVQARNQWAGSPAEQLSECGQVSHDCLDGRNGAVYLQ